MNRESLISVVKGAGIAALGAILTYLTSAISGADFGSYTPMVVAVWSVVANVVRKWISDFNDTSKQWIATQALAVLLAVLILPAGSATAAEPPRLTDAGPPAVKDVDAVQARSVAESSVYISVDLGSGATAGGTGTVIAAENGKSLILTNAHVVPSAAHSITVTYWCDRKPWTSKATYIAGSSVDDVGPSLIRVNGPDLALLSIDADLHPVEIADAIPAAGESVSLYGFGGTGSVVYPRQKNGEVLRDDNWRTTAGDPIARTSIESTHGDSGSGIFNDRGQLVAVLWGGGAVRLDTVHAFTVTTLSSGGRGPGLFPRLHARLAARKIAKAVAAAKAAASVPPPVKAPAPAAPAALAAPASPASIPLASPCPGGVCPAPSSTGRGFFRRR